MDTNSGHPKSGNAIILVYYAVHVPGGALPARLRLVR